MIEFRNNSIKLQIWDSAGQERYKALIPSYVRGAAIIFIIYDISDYKTFANLESWINFIKQVKGGNDATFNRLKSKLVQLCTKQNNPQLITILLLTGMKLRGELIDLDLDKGITISIAGLKRTIPINTIKEIIQED